jgi:hypothetical protein
MAAIGSAAGAEARRRHPFESDRPGVPLATRENPFVGGVLVGVRDEGWLCQALPRYREHERVCTRLRTEFRTP